MEVTDVLSLQMVNINLGDSCNLECRYCFQQGILVPEVINSSSFVSSELLSLLSNSLKLWDDKINFAIRFTGGEPLLYLDKIKIFVDYLRPLKDRIHYLIVTNATLLTADIVSFLNKNKFEVGISNDGIVSKQTRGINVLEDESLLSLICDIRDMHFVCVLSAFNSDYASNIEYFKDKIKDKRQDCYVSVNPVYNTGCCHDAKLFEFDFYNLELSINSFFDSITIQKFLDTSTPEHYLLQRYISRFTNISYFASKGLDITKKISCGTDYNHINVDTSGNCYFCHNCSDKIGTIRDSLDAIFNVYKERGVYNVVNSDICCNCIANPICSGGCPFVSLKDRESYYCKVQKILYCALEKTFIRLSAEVDKL